MLICLTAIGGAQAATYIENGKAGDPASWRSSEFNAEWGLGAIHADQAYAAGYTGKGIKLGIFDQPVYAKHPEFAGENKVINLVTEGIREYTDPYIPVKKGDAFRYDGTPSVDSDGTLGSHGTHVGGIAAGSRDGGAMHGVAFNAQIISAENGDPGPEDGIILGNDGAVYQAGWDALVASGARIINNSWGIGITDKFAKGGKDPAYPHFTVDDAQKQFDQIKVILGTKPGGAYQGAIDAARSGVVTIFAAGNDYNLNNPDAMAGLAYFVPDIAPNWLSVASLQDPTNTGDYSISTFSSRCGYTASLCVSAPGSRVYSSVIEGTSVENLTTGYAKYSGTSMAAPHVAGSVAVLMERFPYLNGAQVADVLKTTATDMGAPGIDALYGWGMINLGKAINGPGMLVTVEDIPAEFRIPDPTGVAYGPTQFVVDLPGVGAVLDKGKPTERVCSSDLCGLDFWSNDISGHGGLTKQGIGTLVLTGNNTYAGPTLVNQGRLAVNGSVTSAVSVQNGGIVGGSGTVGSLTARRGGTVAPGNSIGTLNVAGNVSFEPGSRYAVEVGPNGQSDRIQSSGSATIGGGEVAVTLENSPNLLTQSEVRSLLGQQYNILSAQQGVSGQFDAVAPNYLFLGTGLSYQPTGVTLSVGRNGTSFASVAQTPNERAVAAAADALAAGNPVYESLLGSGTAGEARQAFRQLSGQIHADIASALVNDSRYLREALNGRLRQAEGLASSSAIKADEGGAWAQLLGAWDHASGDANATGYQASTYGVLVGLDSAAADDWRLGVATGYTRTSLHGGYGSKADSDNYHLAAYGDKQFGALALRGGAGYTWHRIDTRRSVNYGMQSDRDTAKYSARTEQLFAEAGYSVQGEWLNLEPFVNLAYVNFENNGIAESGGAAALRGDKQHTDATVSTLGLRADTEWQVSAGTTVALRSELGWQHQYGGLERGTGLRFNGGNAPFVVDSVPVSRDGMVLKAGAEVAVNENATLSLGYGGLLSQHHQDNSVNAGFTWRF
ncbi:autotransporter serine protease [Serratia marcescens]|jgi:subtilase-type serine protease|uniref:Autotransporter outer membrane beta-barrel domain-containing protein n=2 Tax=Serratia TaxID=613 RepID=A0AAP8PG77_SERMA|nr:autotransporter serine protease [Serratia marcescens]PNO64018.1 autotransporter outer membrane beta-barrel domain-containing protein [Serratia marcescens]QDI20950.1 autotransporter outer membrane beta-barrel domain-containing protein [Serratia marcescens]QDI30694.1 autotransporter outer membrane beta-barrel domain-containing protein [Serratia marcescens]QDI45182.1 autotransporter outer membrane beta-barrel domain-containing protein [Serratia marcescens]QDI59605.1 autotransporter outer membr